ncbi:MAG: class I SAM-dependent methyltransferase [Phycisphaerales bacterium]
MTTPQQKPEPSATDAKPAHVYATTRDWPGYFAVTQGRPPRETLIDALDRFANDPIEPPRLAVDLGCGEGRDTAELLRRGWRVHAIDGHPEGIARLVSRDDLTDTAHLTMQLAPMESVPLPRCDLLNASFSLPFCLPDRFNDLWERIVTAINPGGRFAGQLFGDRDTWATIHDRTHHTREQVEQLLAPFAVETLKEEERDGQDCTGAGKHWHAFHIVARKV